MESDQFHDISEDRTVEGPDGQIWQVRRGRTFFVMAPIASPPEVSDEPRSVVDATNDDGDGATHRCETEAEASQKFEEFIRNVQTAGEPMPDPA